MFFERKYTKKTEIFSVVAVHNNLIYYFIYIVVHIYYYISMPNTINVSVVFSVFSPAFKTLSCNLTVFSKKKT